jgi:hypothetical protein
MNRFFYLPAVMVALTSCTAPLISTLNGRIYQSETYSQNL